MLDNEYAPWRPDTLVEAVDHWVNDKDIREAMFSLIALDKAKDEKERSEKALNDAMAHSSRAADEHKEAADEHKEAEAALDCILHDLLG